MFDMSNVDLSLVPYEERMQMLTSPDVCLTVLNNCAGNVRKFVQWFGARVSDPEEELRIYYIAEKTMQNAESDEAYKEWKRAIALNRKCRITLLKFTALDRLEGNKGAVEEKYTDKGVTLKYKEMDDLNFAKLTLGDDLAGAVARAKHIPKGKSRTEELPDDDDEMTAEEEDALARARSA
jgi:hypothetical protein